MIDLTLMNETREKITAMKEEMKQAAVALFGQLFTEFRGLESFSWKQYADFYNDGDPCEFSPRWEYTCRLTVWILKIISTTKHLEMRYVPEHSENCVATIESVLKLIEDDEFRDMWGDDSVVTVTAEGIETHDYGDHD